MTIVSIEEAQANFAALITRLKPGESIEIREAEQPVAELVSRKPVDRKRRKPGSAVGRLVVLAEDDEHLADFGEYMP